jgi:hypothetical protein
MAKAFGLIAILVAMYIGMQIYAEGMDHVLGGVFAPIQPMSQREEPLATNLTPGAQMADAPSGPRPRVRVTDAVRERVSSDLEQGARRRGY